MDNIPQSTPEKSNKFRDRLYSVYYNRDGSPIVHKDENGKSDNQRKRELKEIKKTLSHQERQDIKNKVHRELKRKQNAARVLAMRIGKTVTPGPARVLDDAP